MSIEFLAQYYARAGNLVGSANEMRTAATPHDCKEARRSFLETSTSWAPEMEAYSAFERKHTDFTFSHAAWLHGGQEGLEPQQPEWPKCIPEYEEAMDVVCDVVALRELAVREWDDDQWQSSVQLRLSFLVAHLNSIRALIEAEEDKGVDGPINRNALAKLLLLSAKTLANRSDELPKPIARDNKQVPIYRYQSARKALIEMYADKVFLLPNKYSEIDFQRES